MLSRRTLVAALPAAALAGCGAVARSGHTGAAAAAPSKAGSGARTAEQQWARTAWRYVENNTDADTGLVAGVDLHPVFTAWNAGDAIAAIVCAHELGVIDAHEFDLRLSRVLGFLGTMDLSAGMLPNKAYSSATGRMVNFGNQPQDIGWSAVDVGRLMLWLKIAGQRHPRFAEYADKAVLRWSFCEVIDDCGRLFGTDRSQPQHFRYEEGRLGYQQLAAAGYGAWGFDTRATRMLPATQRVNVDGLPLRVDVRDPRATGVPAAVTTMPYVLAGMECGWTAGGIDADMAQTVYRLQEERWRREHQFTARSDFQLREPPYTAIDSVWGNGYAWNTLGPDGKEYPRFALVNVRAAFGMWALWPGEYSTKLLESVRQMYDADRGWYEGRFESGGGPLANITLSTNAAVLEALLYRATGKAFLGADAQPGFFKVKTGDPFFRPGRCLPGERAACKAA